jgi:hypothetical protein
VVATAMHGSVAQQALSRGDGSVELGEAPLQEEAAADRQF